MHNCYLAVNNSPGKFHVTFSATNLACELTSSMSKVGADGVLVMPPFYFRKRMTVGTIIFYDVVGSKIIIL